MRGPTFIIAGGQRCGTTWLCHILDQHPQVYLAKPRRPEPKFFLRDPMPDRGIDWYLRTWFSGVRDEVAIGEKSTSYMDTPGVPKRIRHFLPEVKIVFILRHPLDRAISNYRFSRAHGLESQPLEFALRNEARRVAHTQFADVSTHPLAYLHRGHYCRFVEHYLQYFDITSLKVLIKVQVDQQPRAMFQELLPFLGVSTSFEPPDLDVPPEPPEIKNLTISRDLVLELIDQFGPSNRRLEQLIGCDATSWDRPSAAVQAMMR